MNLSDMMNALKFLAVDRSLDSAKDVVGRYQVRTRGLLPVLNSGSPPAAGSRTTPRTDRAEPSTPRRSVWRRFLGWVARTNRDGAARRHGRVESQPELPAAGEASVGDGQSGDVGEQRIRSSRFSGYNPFHRAEKKDLQIEFRFENVRVVCNELHDTDFIIKT